MSCRADPAQFQKVFDGHITGAGWAQGRASRLWKQATQEATLVRQPQHPDLQVTLCWQAGWDQGAGP